MDAAKLAKLRGGERGANLGGMMAVIVDHRDAAGLAAHLKAAIDAGIAGDGLANRFQRDVQLQADRDGGRGVQHVVNAGHAQVKLAQIAAARPNREAALEGAAVDVGDLQGGLLAAPVGDDAAIHRGKKLLDVFVVQAQDGRAVERHLLDELEERGADLDDGWIVIQMFAVDVGDHGQDRAELEERAIALVRFHHQEIALADARVRAAHGRGLPAHHHRGIQARGIQHRRGHRRRGGFAVASGDRDAVLQPHQLSQQFAARNDRESAGGALPALPDWRRPRPNSPPSPWRR